MKVLFISSITKRNNIVFGQLNQTSLIRKQTIDNVWADIPDEFKKSFFQIRNKKGKSFIKAAYIELVENMGLQGLAPKRIKFVNLPSKTNAQYDDIYNQIYYSNDAVFINSKSKQIGTLAHELTHCRQSCDLIRSPYFGVEKYAAAISEARINQKIISYDKGFIGPYLEARKKGHGQTYLSNAIKSYSNTILPEIKKGFAQVLKLPKIKNTPERIIYLRENLEAVRTRVDTNISGTSIKNYKSNFREKEAFEAGNKIENYYKAFEKYSANS